MDYVQMFHNLVNLAAVDGKFSDEEVQFLALRAEEWDIPSDEFETAMAGLSVGEVQVHVPEDYDERLMLMKEMIRLMAVDGELAEIEKRLCAMASERMDFSPTEFTKILDEVIKEAN